MGLFYVDNRSFLLDLRLIFLTAVTILSRKKALEDAQRVLNDFGADEKLKRVAKREDELEPFPPPGATEIVTHR